MSPLRVPWLPAVSRVCVWYLLLLHARVVTGAFLPGLLGKLAGTATTVAKPQHLLDCLNDAYQEGPGTTWESAMMEDRPASLKAVASFWSAKPQRIPLTIVTQLSANRLTQLWAQCRTWPGPLSAAVFQALHQPTEGHLSARNSLAVKKTLKALADFHQSTERDAASCKLDIIYTYEIYTDKRAMMLYPVNQMRNLARLQARTELVGLMDVDMLVSSKLARSLQNPTKATLMSQTCKDKTVYVVPAFETYGSQEEAVELADNLVRQSKTFLVRSKDQGSVAPFDFKRFPIGHNTTDFKRWYTTSSQYQIKYSARYEPWIIANRVAVPWHDVRFRGYGQNKIVQVAHTNASGFSFVVHPTGFIIHRAHEVTAARTQLVQDMKLSAQLKAKKVEQLGNNTIYGHSLKLWQEAKRAMDQGKFAPVLDPGTMHCLKALPWWQ